MPTAETSPKTLRPGFRLGPGLLVTAAFIGPGTVVTASKAGAQFGCQLLWTVVLASLGTIVLQSLAARLGISQQKGLGEMIRSTLAESRWKRPAVALVIASIGIGNAAYQTGNLTGAAAGLSPVFRIQTSSWLMILVTLTTTIIWLGRYKILHRFLIAWVAILSGSFLIAGLISLPESEQILRGIVSPSIDADNLTIVLALIGTTIVPYNLFLHASSAATTWQGENPRDAVRQSDWDTCFSVLLGGFVTASILTTASAAFYQSKINWNSIDEIAVQLRPALGDAGGVAFAVGLFAAGLTSSITAPIATAYAVCGSLGWKADPSSRRFRAIAIAVVWIGGYLAIHFGKSPALTIQFAQVANGLLLPIVGCFLLAVVVKPKSSPLASLSRWRLVSAFFAVLAVALLGIWRTISVLR
ncbi:Nramp family divalent metal transporter [Stieleria sp. TO1_6]|uniref:Nramp family divalent metal transporter n=1 Tax=Stieleria tagensis TaxID=2956795 RepID=UPI00209B71AF|nr:Nramp family divalent metal transporter [Stieleria tagensis]MCO8124995.1 Nramp family divalent metal transporter [Stieleria tagensis]